MKEDIHKVIEGLKEQIHKAQLAKKAAMKRYDETDVQTQGNRVMICQRLVIDLLSVVKWVP